MHDNSGVTSEHGNATWYRVRRYRFGKERWIEPVQVSKATERFVQIVGGIRAAKSSSYEDFYPSWDQAHCALLVRFDQQIERFEREITEARKLREEVLALTKDAPA